MKPYQDDREKAASDTSPGPHEVSGEAASSPSAPLSAHHFQAVAFLAKSLADENRLRILFTLTDGKRSVSSIVEELELSQPLVSHHLKELKRSLLVRTERSGPFIYYDLADSRILEVIRGLGSIAADLLATRKTF